MLDKTGTVTTGQMTLLDIVTADGVDGEQALRLVGALEDASEHPIARAIATAAKADSPLPAVEGFTNREGLGVQGIVGGHAIVAGRPALLADWAMHLPAELDAARQAAEARGQTAIVAGWDGVPPRCSSSPTRSSPPRPRRSAAEGARSAYRSAHRGQRDNRPDGRR